jgi:hypothetical protein
MLKKMYLTVAILFLVFSLSGCPAKEKDGPELDTKGIVEQSPEARPQEIENPFQTDKDFDEKEWAAPKEWGEAETWDENENNEWDEKDWNDPAGWDTNEKWDNDGTEWQPEKE